MNVRPLKKFFIFSSALPWILAVLFLLYVNGNAEWINDTCLSAFINTNRSMTAALLILFAAEYSGLTAYLFIKWKKDSTGQSSAAVSQTDFVSKINKLLKKNPEEELAVCRICINRFSIYNDTYGMDAGDMLLQKIEKILQTGIINSGFLTVCHERGAHFLLCRKLEGTDPDAICIWFTEQLRTVNPEYSFSVHAGLCSVSGKQSDIHQIISRTFTALKTVGESVEKWAWFDSSMLSQERNDSEIIKDLEKAFKEKQFTIVFHPQFNYTDGKISGAEILVRWNHPEKGFIHPSRFIPVLEKNGLIFDLDREVWEQTCIFLRSLDERHMSIPYVSVNISKRDFYNKNLISTLTDLCEKYEINPEKIHLEITESAYVENQEMIIDSIHSLKKAGFLVEIDNFGDGYTPLSLLRDMPFDYAKININLLYNSEKNEGNRNLISSLIQLSRHRDLPVIAYGVEKKEQAEFLKSIGCYIMQGFLFCSPMTQEEMEKLLIETGISSCFMTPAEQTVDFLDDTTQEALLFNSFVGGAYIQEYTGTTTEVLRANDRLFEEMEIPCTDWHKEISVEKILSGDHLKNYLKMLDDAVSTGREATCEACSFTVHPGREHWARIRARCIAKKPSGSVFYCSLENITKQKEDEARIRLSEAEYRAAARQSNSIICRYIVRDRMFMLTDEETGIFDYGINVSQAPDEFIRMGYIAEGSLEKWKNIFSAIDRGENGTVQELCLKPMKDSDFRWFRITFSTIQFSEGAPMAAVFSFRDITDSRAQEKNRAFEYKGVFTALSGIYRVSFACNLSRNEFYLLKNSSFINRRFDTDGRYTDLVESTAAAVYEDDKNIFRNFFAPETIISRINDSMEHLSVEFREYDEMKKLHWVESSIIHVPDPDGSDFLCLIISRNIDERRKEEEERRRNSEVLSGIGIGTWSLTIRNSQKSSLFMDDTMKKIINYTGNLSPEEMLESFLSRIHPDHRETVNMYIQNLYSGAFLEETYLWKHPDLGYIYVRDGGKRDLSVSGSEIRLNGYFQNVNETVLKEKQTMKELKQALFKYRKADNEKRTDFLTGLYNRLDLFDMLRDALSGKEGTPDIQAMFMMDIDNYKSYNDHYGHVAGDDVLKQIGASLRKYGSKNHIRFYRYGGEEILGISVSMDKGPDTVADELVNLIRNLNIKRDDIPSGRITVSLGYTGDNSRYEKMINLADSAMYKAKTQGKDRAVSAEQTDL